MIRALGAVAWTSIFGLAVACAASTSPASPPTSPASEACPLGVRGAVVSVESTKLGVALTFTAPPEQRTEIRLRAQTAAKMTGPGGHTGLGHDGHHAEGGHHGLRGLLLPTVEASASAVETGARIDLVPFDPADRAALEAEASRAVERMNSMPCD